MFTGYSGNLKILFSIPNDYGVIIDFRVGENVPAENLLGLHVEFLSLKLESDYKHLIHIQ